VQKTTMQHHGWYTNGFRQNKNEVIVYKKNTFSKLKCEFAGDVKACKEF